MSRSTYGDKGSDPRNYRVSFDKIANGWVSVATTRCRIISPALTAAVRAGMFPHAADNGRLGNFEVKHLA